LYYKFFKTLPKLTPKINYYIPSDIGLINSLENIEFEIVDIEYPYIHTPYASVVADHIKFITKIFIRHKLKFPFWKNSINIIARKV